MPIPGRAPPTEFRACWRFTRARSLDGERVGRNPIPLEREGSRWPLSRTQDQALLADDALGYDGDDHTSGHPVGVGYANECCKGLSFDGEAWWSNICLCDQPERGRR